MKTFKTPMGTIIPIRDMKGKDYLEVAWRVLWMREEHPEWGVETEFLELSPTSAIAKATIRDGQGKIIAQGTKTENPQGFADFVEKAETGAIGRALALCGYGTQYTQDFDEGERIVDAPRPSEMGQVKTFPQKAAPVSEFASPAQVGRLQAIAKKVGMPPEDLKRLALSMGIQSSQEIPKNKYEALCSTVEAWNK